MVIGNNFNPADKRSVGDASSTTETLKEKSTVLNDVDETKMIEEKLNDPKFREAAGQKYVRHFGAKLEKQGIAEQKTKTKDSLDARKAKAAKQDTVKAWLDTGHSNHAKFFQKDKADGGNKDSKPFSVINSTVSSDLNSPEGRNFLNELKSSRANFLNKELEIEGQLEKQIQDLQKRTIPGDVNKQSLNLSKSNS